MPPAQLDRSALRFSPARQRQRHDRRAVDTRHEATRASAFGLAAVVPAAAAQRPQRTRTTRRARHACECCLREKQQRGRRHARRSLVVRCEHLVRAAGDDRIAAEAALVRIAGCAALRSLSASLAAKPNRETRPLPAATYASWPASIRATGSHRPPGRASANHLLAGAELLHGALGVLDGLGVVAEELGRLAPGATYLYGVGK
jgi:hypothetical protein